MIYIAHRGLFNGCDPETENHPDQITLALSLGFDVEIDLWTQDKNWYLGHDGPTYKIDVDFLFRRGLWIHCKSITALLAMTTHKWFDKPNYFWHQQDDYTITSHRNIWQRR